MIVDFEPTVTYTSSETDAERKINEQFEFNTLRGKPALMLAGFIMRGAIDVARYNRSIEANPERSAHYERLIRCATRFMNGRVTEYYGSHGSEIVDQAEIIIRDIDWQFCDLEPTITRPGAVPYDGTEPSWVVDLAPPIAPTRTYRMEIPA